MFEHIDNVFLLKQRRILRQDCRRREKIGIAELKIALVLVESRNLSRDVSAKQFNVRLTEPVSAPTHCAANRITYG